jgi:hypothetical protein
MSHVNNSLLMSFLIALAAASLATTAGGLADLCFVRSVSLIPNALQCSLRR